MTTPTNPDRDHPAPPSAREIAALTARLRDLSSHPRGADPAERAAFLADKDALIVRITAGLPDTPAPAGTDRAAAGRRLAEPARPDDPAEVATRVGELRERVAGANAATGELAGGRSEFHQHRPNLNRIRPALPDDGAYDGFYSWTGPQDTYAFGEYDHAPDDLDDDAATAAGEIGWEDAAVRGRHDPSTKELVEQAHTAAAGLPDPRPAAGEADRREQLAAWHADDQTAANDAPDDARTGPGPDPAIAREW